MFKKIISILLCVIFIFALSIPVFANDQPIIKDDTPTLYNVCFQCGSAMRYIGREFVQYVDCERFPLGSAKLDSLYMMIYEYRVCFDVDNYVDYVCTH